MGNSDTLQQAGIRQTPIRKAILGILSRTTKPISVPELESEASLVELGSDTVTIYRTLETFFQAGIVTRVEFQEGKFRYELSGRTHHHHIVCTSCGYVVDIQDCISQTTQDSIAAQNNFSITNHSIEFFGLCENCRTA